MFHFFKTDTDQAKCPENCKCSDVFKHVDCANISLTEIPKNLPLNTIRLDLSHNQLTILNISNLIDCHDLRELILSNNKIEAIHDNAVSELLCKKQRWN